MKKRTRDGAHAAAPLYEGYAVPHAGWQVAVVDARTVTPESFFEDYVKSRKPVVLDSHAPLGRGWKGAAQWADLEAMDAALAAAGGGGAVKVEERAAGGGGGGGGGFGAGRTGRMPVRDAVARAARGDEGMYLTTQDVDDEAPGAAGLMASPLSELRAWFPLRPALAGNLLPAQYNI